MFRNGAGLVSKIRTGFVGFGVEAKEGENDGQLLDNAG
jgi:hypothetical protein